MGGGVVGAVVWAVGRVWAVVGGLCRVVCRVVLGVWGTCVWGRACWGRLRGTAGVVWWRTRVVGTWGAVVVVWVVVVVLRAEGVVVRTNT